MVTMKIRCKGTKVQMAAAYLLYMTVNNKMSEKAYLVAAELLTVYSSILDKITDEELVNKLVLSKDEKKRIKTKYKISPQYFNSVMKDLESSGIIVDGKINTSYLPVGKMEITFDDSH